MFLIQIWSVKTNFIFVLKSWCQTWHILICLRLKLETSIYLEEPQMFSDFFYFTVQFPYSAFLVYKLSWFSSCYLNPVSYGGMFRISAKICFFIFLSHPTQDLLAANVRHSPFLAPKTPPPLTRSEFRKGWNKNWNVNILRNAFQSLETFFRNFMII